jgi:alpha-amylase/alpha-mannosidase (GH57 family)
LFFYDRPLARAITKEQLLEEEEALLQRLLESTSDSEERSQLICIATDGEVYGHHQRAGCRALSYTLRSIVDSAEFELTVFGEALELFPPDAFVEIVEKSSWSCPHRLGRWKEDCGCQTGGPETWNQGWRKPLREALNWLRDQLAAGYEQEALELVDDPWELRNHYVDALTQQGQEAFWGRHAPRVTSSWARKKLTELLEMQRNCLMMFTSCGWFFNDVTGLEPIQILRNAGRALDYARKLLPVSPEAGFLDLLTDIHSNLPSAGDGRKIFEELVRTKRQG